MLLACLEPAVLRNKQVPIMTTTILNQLSLSKLNKLLFARQTPVASAPTHRSIRHWFADWRRRRQAAAELAGLSDRALADIGLTRQDIPVIARRGK